jgi:hypothetical protein
MAFVFLVYFVVKTGFSRLRALAFKFSVQRSAFSGDKPPTVSDRP